MSELGGLSLRVIQSLGAESIVSTTAPTGSGVTQDASVATFFANRTDGQAKFGAPKSWDRSVSTFDVKHSLAATFAWDLPFGRGGSILSNPPKLLGLIIEGWKLSGTGRVRSAYPFIVALQDNNYYDATSGGAFRPNLVPSVPSKPVMLSRFRS